MNVKMPFLSGYLKEEVYMEQPEGFIVPGKENKVFRFVNNLCVLIIETNLIRILEIKNYLSSNFKNDLGEVDTFLGIKVRMSESQISLSQSHYIEKILTKFQHLNIKEAVAQLEYASAIGCMMYAMHYIALDPYIYFAVSRLSQFTSNPALEGVWESTGGTCNAPDCQTVYNMHNNNSQ
ncbi:hypothetical protein OSB04_029307 [Centaurea solstitialis]|uniref:Reverse transcriptase Ty1/copia-type domain-containing protein n=1 Tax=Centaurea solstitialis TaxID=347529 RepID=A0AA38SUA0_9ASTR|nr:hypothetical protein OSB04_029307 [Centaurea solstitialis]